MLSYNDIIKEIGKKIYIYPLNVDNIRGNSINLTASNIAYSTDGRHLIKNINGKDKIVIYPGEVALIETKEVIYISKDIGGTYHSKVGRVSKGLSHIGTTLDPGYIGTSLISISNNCNSEVEFDVGDTIVSVILHYLNTSTKYENTNSTSDHVRFFEEAGVQKDEIRNIESVIDKEWNKNKVNLKSKMEDDEGYSKFEKKKNEIRNKKILGGIKTHGIPCLLLIILGLIIYYLDRKYINIGKTPDLTEKYLMIVLTAFMVRTYDKIVDLMKGE